MKASATNQERFSTPPRVTDRWCPELVSWNVTQRCNLRCDHCYLAAGKEAPAELSFEEGCQLIDHLVSCGTRMLILTGGEPLMRGDVFDLAAHASSRGLLVVLGTNGVLLNSREVQALRSAGVSGVGISLDSGNPGKHDGFRGVSGAWDGAVRALRACVEQELPVLLQMTVLPWNYQEVTEVMEFAYREGASGFNLYFLVCTGRGERLSDISPLQYDQALALVVEAQKRYPRMMVRARCAPHISRIASQRSSSLVGNAGCLAARQYCRITPGGEVTPCPYLPLVAGSVRQQPFPHIWRNAPLFHQMRERGIEGRCGRCDFAEVCGGCRARAFSLTGNLFGEDPWCTYSPPESAPVITWDEQPRWTREAQERLEPMPQFIRERVRLAVERYAQAHHEGDITPAVVAATLEDIGRSIPFRRPPGVRDGS